VDFTLWPLLEPEPVDVPDVEPDAEPDVELDDEPDVEEVEFEV